MKSLMGLSRSGNTKFEGMANRHTDSDMLALTNSINEFLVSASSEIPKLTDSHCVFDHPLPDQMPTRSQSLADD